MAFEKAILDKLTEGEELKIPSSDKPTTNVLDIPLNYYQLVNYLHMVQESEVLYNFSQPDYLW
jgi:hypothetical protein